MQTDEKITMVFERTNTYRIGYPTDALPHIAKLQRKKQEHFAVILLDGAHQVIKTVTVTQGLVNRTLVHPREVFHPAIKHNAVSIILAHNHPSGNIVPSAEDNEITDRIKKAGDIIGINILDHVIISKAGYYSYLENGAL